MYLIYFDETKFETLNPYFFIGGILVEEGKLSKMESALMQIQYNFFQTNILSVDTELHGSFIFQGKGVYKKRKLPERLKLFEDVTQLIIDHQIPIRLVCIDVNRHRKKYKYPQPEYNLGLMLILERFCDFLEEKNDIGVVFGDYEKDEITTSILDFSQFKFSGKTPMSFGRPLGQLKDTIYFTHSHHSRFLQAADMVLFMANRFENGHQPVKWHDIKLKEIWDRLKGNCEIRIQRWP